MNENKKEQNAPFLLPQPPFWRRGGGRYGSLNSEPFAINYDGTPTLDQMGVGRDLMFQDDLIIKFWTLHFMEGPDLNGSPVQGRHLNHGGLLDRRAREATAEFYNGDGENDRGYYENRDNLDQGEPLFVSDHCGPPFSLFRGISAHL